MSPADLPRFLKVTFLDAAMADLHLIAERSRPVLVEVFRLLRLLDAGQLSPTPLRDFAKTGDLTDCGKIVVRVGGQPEYRIVVWSEDGTFAVSEVVAVEDRTSDLPYLLAGLRLGRVSDPVRRSDTRRRVERIRRMLGDEPSARTGRAGDDE